MIVVLDLIAAVIGVVVAAGGDGDDDKADPTTTTQAQVSSTTTTEATTTTESTTTTTTEPADTDQTVTATDDSASIDLPATWETTELNARPQAVFEYAGPSRDAFLLGLRFDKADPTSTPNLDQLIVVAANELRSSLDAVRQSAPRTTTIGGNDARQLGLSGVLKTSSTVRVNYLVTVLDTGDDLWEVVTWCESGSFGAYQRIFRGMLESFDAT